MILDAQIITRPISGEFSEVIYDSDINSVSQSQIWTWIKFTDENYEYWCGQFRGAPISITKSTKKNVLLILTSNYLFLFDLITAKLIKVVEDHGYQNLTSTPDGNFIVSTYYNIYKINNNDIENPVEILSPIQLDMIKFGKWNDGKLSFSCDEFINWDRHLEMTYDYNSNLIEIQNNGALKTNKLSVIIVSYNVKYYLDQCLHSVMAAAQGLAIEVWVVDNNSTDGSVAHVQANFPSVKVIANLDNKGFSKANNQAVIASNAEYVVLLNPDTVVSEDTFAKTIAFFDATPNCGGLTVKMVDGFGQFLPESKRGLPTPEVAFYKIFGLSTLLPKSKKFGQYHLGYLSENETNVIDVLSGAYMMMRMETLDKCGVLDENFFMYGEDIDLSYRITLAGYKNYYYPHTKIIHYKGESTKKSSINYVMVFYKAMIIFSEKHFTKRFNKGFTAMINVAIYLRAGLAILNRFFTLARFVFFDIALYLFLFGVLYSSNVTTVQTVLFTSALMSIQFLQGNYSNDRHWLGHAITNVLGVVVLYGTFACVLTPVLMLALLLVLFVMDILTYNVIVYYLNTEHSLLAGNYKRVLIISNNETEYESIFSIINQDKKFIANDVLFLSLEKALLLSKKETAYCSEIVFSSSKIPYASIINIMEQWRGLGTEFKIYIAPHKYITSTSNLYIRNKFVNATAQLQPYQVWQRRFISGLFSIATLLASPFLLATNKSSVVQQAIKCLLSSHTWLGINSTAFYTPSLLLVGTVSDSYDTYYYKNYSIKNDILTLTKLWVVNNTVQVA